MTQESVGEFLKRERELRQITLEEVAEGTKISIRRLRSIEADQFDDLPAEVFVKGFIKAYAEYIGIDPTDALLRLEENMPQDELDIKNVRRLSSPSTDIRRPKSPVLLIVAIVAATLVAVAAWFFFFQGHQLTIQPLTGRMVGTTEGNSSSLKPDSNAGITVGPQILLEQEAEGPTAVSGNSDEALKEESKQSPPPQKP